ncbi:hypothetical protein A3D80_00465 [Candidatus Roizmanbacteria bacterium RIFCSPHIGHO2_02_FULL_40_13b]|uniref:R3H domain-containing protein n=1 Tax=Candidatus Roizmanbacteria bacterium RIFCSPHIGHO2_01_FULL_39_24 TaxID=1802032 RepID=A0A1F7GK88_9BACT|nr:MAG: hypothetical protein A2799_02430 [Candidatus Roizmanbacteria bacterium RIFCSPHIGHO2_01_FULL_39_24]OGK27420.1 MAG: hypothetical protein A3D80_00465 [Candidatus Roizmanbacteria bacterium RIFCSPHIGHO2_02_FULL_40_13b]OGK50435.1 MAG: hypothetical protein A3A56_02285 [Candidatus Roizmanbacteria bacterium RIFCSPLOWO2_01_FULL_40_32]OGK56392.1 MAG: hypothetical protein A3H83_01085 [Candidatus Roizmanbacteria bacterium RIFCSPLOWO2_02_FULL_39_8]
MEEQEVIKTLTLELLGKMGFSMEPTITKEEGDVYLVTIEESEDSSLLIGKFGATLSSLQTVLEAILFKKFGKKVNIAVNIGDYRERQKERVEGIAENVATRVKEENRQASLQSFSAYERKLIHEYISKNHPDLTSTSEGEGRERKLIIEKKTKDGPVDDFSLFSDSLE